MIIIINIEEVVKLLNNQIIIAWAPISISVLSIIIAGFNHHTDRKLSKRNFENTKEMKDWQREFDIYKEKVKQQEKESNLLLKKIESRSIIAPYFNLILDNSKLRLSKQNKIIGISLVNIGKESATNVSLCKWDKEEGMDNYFVTTPIKHYNHYVHKYLDKTYAMPRDKIYLEVIVDDNNEIIRNQVQFKVQYSDLIGRTYEQEFKFGYGNDRYNKGVDIENYSRVPKLIKDIE
ncbi:hypothetical protein CBG19_08090 [Limosilactobacillus reuteri]|nr:hypothetical protein CBG19_08090 [Limosilactobacillus reuteri]